MVQQLQRTSPLSHKHPEQPDSARPPFGARLLRNALWLVPSLIIALLLVEFVFAASHVGEEEFMRADPITGFWHKENKFVTFRGEGYSQGAINSAGMRDIEHSVAKPPGTVRVAVLGNSMVEALQVPLSQTFCKMLESDLNKQTEAGNKYEVLNFGMSAFSTVQEYLLHKNKVEAYQPDLTIVVFTSADTGFNAGDSASASTPRPYAAVSQKGDVYLGWDRISDWMNGEKARFMHHFPHLADSRLWGVWSRIEVSMGGDKSFAILKNTLGVPIEASWKAVMRSMPPVSWAPPPTRIPQAPQAVLGALSRNYEGNNPMQALMRRTELNWVPTAAMLCAINEECRKSGSKLLVAALPAPSGSIFYLRELNLLKDLAKQQGFSFVNIHEVFPPIVVGEKSAQYYGAHFSPAGHRLVTDTLLNPVRQLLLSPQPESIKPQL